MNPIRSVPFSLEKLRCFYCGAFLSVNLEKPSYSRCSSCGVVHDLSDSALGIEARRVKTASFIGGLDSRKPGLPASPEGNAHTFLQPNGKITKKKISVRPDSGQLALFGGDL